MWILIVCMSFTVVYLFLNHIFMCVENSMYLNKYALQCCALCAVCSRGLLLVEGQCVNSCPLGSYLDPSNQCAKCHYSCKACSGPNDYQCSVCHGDAILVSFDQVYQLITIISSFKLIHNIKFVLSKVFSEGSSWYCRYDTFHIDDDLLCNNICNFLSE